MLDLILDLYQENRISSAAINAKRAREELEDARSDAARLRLQVADLQRKADALTITCQALWEIVRDRLGATEQQLLDKMQEIDLRDGEADGRTANTLQNCPHCARGSNANRRNCLYCGSLLPPSPTSAASRPECGS